MPSNIDYSDTVHTGAHVFELPPTVPAGAFGDGQLGTANPVTCPKLKHQYAPAVTQPHGAAAVTERRVIHVARSAGDVVAVEVGHVVPGSGGATLTVDVRKNGTSILSGGTPVSDPVAGLAYAKVAGALNVAAAPYAAGDVFEVVFTATAGGGTLPQAPFCSVVFREGAG